MISFEMGFNLEFEEEKQRLDALAKEYSSLLAEYDELTSAGRVNLEAEYMLQIGRKEYQIFQLQVQARQLKREIDLYQAAKNHGDTISREAVDEIIEKEFAEYKELIAAHQQKIKMAEDFHFSKKLKTEEVDAIKKLYHDLVRKLHPDLNPNLPEKAQLLWLKIVDAYKNWNWSELELLSDIAYDLLNSKEIPALEFNCMEELLDQKTKLKDKIAALKVKMEDVQKRPPYCYRELLADRQAVLARRKELDALKQDFEDQMAKLVALRDNLRGENG